MVLLAPIAPAAGGSGLAMRTELFRRAAELDHEVHVVVVPVAGGAPPAQGTLVPCDPLQARAGMRSLLVEPAWRERLARVGRLPRAARAASPGLADAVADALGGLRADALHVARAYMAPLGVAVAERLGVAARTLDLDDDDVAAFAAVHGDRREARAYGRMIDVFAPLCGRLCAASASEARAIAARHGLPVEHVPNGVDIPASLARAPAPELRLLFLGNLTYAPNVEAARTLASELMPLLSERLAGRVVRATLAGEASPAVQRLASPSVRVLGFVAQLAPLYAASDVVLAPLRSGAGTRIKLLEAFAHRVPVVATPAAAEGLEVEHRRHLLLADDAAALVGAVAELAADPELARRLSERAARLVAERYSHEAVIPRIRAFLMGASAAAQP